MSETAYSLDGIELLSDISSEARQRIAKSCAFKRYGPHEQIIDRQSDSRDLYFIVQGRARVVIYTLSGREVTLDDLEEGTYFGELAALDGQPRSASVMALTDTVAASLPPARFTEMLTEHPEVALKVMLRLAWVVRMSTDRIMDLSTLGANNRVHAELLRQARIVRADDEDVDTVELRPIPVHGDIASRVSTTRETVARVMNDLARKGIVERRKDRLVIRSIDRLEEMVEEVRGE